MATTSTPLPGRFDADQEDSVDPDEHESGGLGQWLADDPIRTASLVVTVLALAVRASVLKDSFFITDDFMLSARAVESPLSFDYLTRVHTGHFEPIGFAVMWALAHFAPLSWGWTSVVILAGQLVLSVMVWKMLVELFGRRPMVLAPYALFCITPLTLPGFTWLAAAIIWLPLMIGIAGAIRWHVRYVRSGRPHDAIVATLWFVVGLASFEKVVVYLPYAVVLTVALSPMTRLRLRPLWRLAVRTWVVWAGYALASVVYLALYISGSEERGSSTLAAPKAGTLSDFAFISVFRTFIPGVFGGPWSWQPGGNALAIVDSPRAFDWACWILAMAAIVSSLMLRRKAGRFWFALLVYLAGSIATIALGRVAYGGAILALETRYLADAVVPLVVTVGICLMGLKGERSPWTPLAHRSAATIGRRPQLAAMAGVALLVVALSFHAIGGYSQFSTNNPARSFVSNTTDSLATLPADAQIYDTEMPGQIIGPLFNEYNLVSRYLAPLVSESRRRDMYLTRSLTKPYVITGSGALVPLRVEPAATSTAAVGSCIAAKDGVIEIPLSRALYDWAWTVRVGYIADSNATVSVGLGAGRAALTVTSGLGEGYVKVVGAGQTIRVTDIPTGVNVCVGDIQIGLPAQKP